jgi:hypothetical protein
MIGGTALQNSWTLNLISNSLLVVVFPFFGLLGDHMGLMIQNSDEGYRRMLQIGAVLMIIFAIPAFVLIDSCSTLLVVFGQLLFVVTLSTYGSSLPAFMIAKFPPVYRCTGVGIAYNIANAVQHIYQQYPSYLPGKLSCSFYKNQVFAGTAPLFQTELTALGRIGGFVRPAALYLIGVSVLALVSLTFYAPYCDWKHHAQHSVQKRSGGIVDSIGHATLLPSREIEFKENLPQSLSVV